MCFHLPKEIRNYFLEKILGSMRESEKRAFTQYLNSHTMYCYNMFIMSRKLFKEYFAFMERYISLCVDLVNRNELGIREFNCANKRVLGFLLEHISSFWIVTMKNRKELKVVTTNVDFFNIQKR